MINDILHMCALAILDKGDDKKWNSLAGISI